MKQFCEECQTDLVCTEASIVMRGRKLCAAHGIIYLIRHINDCKVDKLDGTQVIFCEDSDEA